MPHNVAVCWLMAKLGFFLFVLALISLFAPQTAMATVHRWAYAFTIGGGE